MNQGISYSSSKQAKEDETFIWAQKNLFEGKQPPELSLPTDVTFIVGEENPKIIAAHKYPLALRSPVFNTMFNSQLAETGDSIRIPDLDPVGFKNMLR